MINKSVRIVLFLIMSVLEVRLHAAGFVDQPENCFSKKQFPCAIKNSSLTQNISLNSISLSPQGVLQWESEKQITLVKGSVLVDNKLVTVSSLYANIDVNGTAYIEYDDKMIKVEVYKGISIIDKDNELGSGMQTLIPGYNKAGKLIVEAPRPIIYENSIRNWEQMSYTSVTPDSKKELKLKVKEVVEIAAQTYKNEINRQIANHKKRIADQKQRRLERLKEIEKLNNLFKQKNYLSR